MSQPLLERSQLFQEMSQSFGKLILRNSTFGGRGDESEFSRSSVGVFREGIREVKETAILTKVLFEL